MRAWRSERAMEALAEKRAKGMRWTRHPGYGNRWSGRRGHQRRVPDPGERRVMAAILAWWQDGCSWYEIARHLMLNKVHTAEGREWSRSRVRRAFVAQLRLMASESNVSAHGGCTKSPRAWNGIRASPFLAWL
jgi:hypothetical protein